MGVARGMIKLFMREGKRENFTGKRILTIGRQVVFATANQLKQWASEMNFTLKPNVTMIGTHSKKSSIVGRKFIADTSLFISLGFDSIDSLDCSDYEKCTIVHDLNQPVPIKLYDTYDLVFDGGSSEHIFDIRQVFENYHRMLKVGGRMVFAAPTSNYVDHGFYMFSPTLFWDYYSANKWQILDCLLIQNTASEFALWNIYRYVPGCLMSYSFGGLGNKMYSIYFVAKKTDKSSYTVSVQQGSYVCAWEQKETNPVVNSLSADGILKKFVKRIIPKSIRQYLRSFSAGLRAKLPLRYCLKLVARY